MKNGTCPKCNSSNIYSRTGVMVFDESSDSWVYLDTGRSGWTVCEQDVYICTDCGYYEAYIKEQDIQGNNVWEEVALEWDKVGF